MLMMIVSFGGRLHSSCFNLRFPYFVGVFHGIPRDFEYRVALVLAMISADMKIH